MLVWSEEYELGIEVIDSQHRRIVDYINQVTEYANNGNCENGLRELLNNLVDYTFSHFAFEESLLEDSDYEDLREHQLAHKNFSDVVNHIKSEFEAGSNPTEIALSLTQLLKDWLIRHILTEDKAYVATVSAKLLNMPIGKKQQLAETGNLN